MTYKKYYKFSILLGILACRLVCLLDIELEISKQLCFDLSIVFYFNIYTIELNFLTYCIVLRFYTYVIDLLLLLKFFNIE